jgi:hypothetical protein
MDIRRDPLMTDPAPCEEARKGVDPVAGVFPEAYRRTPKAERIVYKGD